VLLGKQAVGRRLEPCWANARGSLDWPQATFASDIKISPDGIQVTREVDFAVPNMPSLCQPWSPPSLRLNTPPQRALPMVMKPGEAADRSAAAEFGIDLAGRLVVEKVSAPPERSGGRRVIDMTELAKIVGRLRPQKRRLADGRAGTGRARSRPRFHPLLPVSLRPRRRSAALWMCWWPAESVAVADQAAMLAGGRRVRTAADIDSPPRRSHRYSRALRPNYAHIVAVSGAVGREVIRGCGKSSISCL